MLVNYDEDYSDLDEKSTSKENMNVDAPGDKETNPNRESEKVIPTVQPTQQLLDEKIEKKLKKPIFYQSYVLFRNRTIPNLLSLDITAIVFTIRVIAMPANPAIVQKVQIIKEDTKEVINQIIINININTVIRNVKVQTILVALTVIQTKMYVIVIYTSVQPIHQTEICIATKKATCFGINQSAKMVNLKCAMLVVTFHQTK